MDRMSKTIEIKNSLSNSTLNNNAAHNNTQSALPRDQNENPNFVTAETIRPKTEVRTIDKLFKKLSVSRKRHDHLLKISRKKGVVLKLNKRLLNQRKQNKHLQNTINASKMEFIEMIQQNNEEIREELSKLRAALDAHKNTAETALVNLKLKYEKERTIVNHTMAKLQAELKMLRKNMDDLTRQWQAAVDDNKKYGQLLQLAVRQKLAVTHRLEQIEMNR